MAKNPYRHTVGACYVGFVVQAIINNFAPLLFLTFENTYQISSEQIALLITVNFGTQLTVDLLSAYFVDRIGTRCSILLAHICSAVGLFGLGIFPDLLPSPYLGLILAVVTYAIGSGLIEVLMSPMVEACPSENKAGSMSLLHSFYCWGQVTVVGLSTLFFVLFGIENWKILAMLWALVPLGNLIAFCRVPLCTLTEDGKSAPLCKILSSGVFWVIALMMLCAGACEMAMCQWASTFAEAGLGVSKTVGDLLGPCAFAVMMGLSRLFFGKFSEKIPLCRFMLVSAVLCVCCYLTASLAPSALLSLLGCALCGLSVGIMWPGTFSIASARMPKAGTALFSLLALAGDFGCASGPAVVGISDNLHRGIFTAVIFPALLCIATAILLWDQRKKDAK